MSRTAEITLEYQGIIPSPPAQPKDLYATACSSDSVTIDAWAQTWIDNITDNRKHVGGDFAPMGVGNLFGKFQNKACILAGSGPSLRVNGEQLKERHGLPLISCLHNFHFFEDRGVKPDFYVSLDAGPVVLEEISEGGSLTPDEYWERTEGHKLVAYIGSNPELIKRWRGEVFFFNAGMPHGEAKTKADEAAGFHTMLGSGGNVLGACLYLAKGILGCQTVAFVGADFSFDYKNKFHGWDSKYDKELGQYMRVTDIYGIKVNTWRSYHNFKCWFDFMAIRVPGFIVNCTEGGIFGAYPEGNISAVKQMGLKQFLDMYNLNHHIEAQCKTPEAETNTILF